MVVFLCLCCLCCGNSLWAFLQSVVGILAIRKQCFGNPSAAVGVRFIVPTYMYSPAFAIRLKCLHGTFATCSLSVCYIFAMQKYGFWRAKPPFLHCKPPLFGVQEVGFCKALISRWLHCFVFWLDVAIQ